MPPAEHVVPHLARCELNAVTARLCVPGVIRHGGNATRTQRTFQFRYRDVFGWYSSDSKDANVAAYDHASQKWSPNGTHVMHACMRCMTSLITLPQCFAAIDSKGQSAVRTRTKLGRVPASGSSLLIDCSMPCIAEASRSGLWVHVTDGKSVAPEHSLQNMRNMGSRSLLPANLQLQRITRASVWETTGFHLEDEGVQHDVERFMIATGPARRYSQPY